MEIFCLLLCAQNELRRERTERKRGREGGRERGGGRGDKAMETEERGVDAEGEINGEQDFCALAASHNDGDGGVSLFPFVGFMFSRGSTASPLGSLCHCGGDTGARSPSGRVRRIRQKIIIKKLEMHLIKMSVTRLMAVCFIQ